MTQPAVHLEGNRLAADCDTGAIGMIQHVQQTHQPVILTIGGKAEAVLLDAQEYENVLNALAMAKVLLKAEDDIIANRVLPVREFFKEFRRDKGV